MLGSRDIAITLRALVGDFVTPIQTAGNELKTFGREAVATIETIEQKGENLSHVWKAMFEAFLGVEMIDGLKKIAEAADQASLALETASRITHNLGHDFDAGEAEDWLKRLAASAQGGGYAITEMRKAMQSLSATGATEGQQKQMLVNVIGLAAARGEKDLADATHIATMAAEGHIEMLSRYGLQVKKSNGELMSFSEVMTNWNKLVAGAAEERAKGLEGAFGRVSNATNALAVAFGKALMPEFVGAANAIAKVISAIAGLPPWLLAAAAGVAFTTVSLTALGLMLPVVTKAFVFFKDGMSLAWAAMSLGPKAIKFVWMALVDLVTWLGLAREAFTTMTVAEWLSQAPLIGIIAAIAGVIAGIAVLIFTINELGVNWQNVTKFMSTAWGEFVNNVLGSREALTGFFTALVEMMSVNPVTRAQGAADMAKSMAEYTPKTGALFVKGAQFEIDKITGYAKSAWKAVVDFFGSALGSLKMPNIDWSGLGGPGKNGAIDLHPITDPIDAQIAAAKHKVEQAQNALQETSAKLAVLRDKRDPQKPLTKSNVAEEQRLEREELERTLAVRTAIAHMRDTELKAAALEQFALGKIHGSTKAVEAAHAEIVKRMNEHISAASKLNGEWIKLGGTTAKVSRNIAHVFDPLTNQQIDLGAIARTGEYNKGRAAFDLDQQNQKSKYAVGHVLNPGTSDQSAIDAARFKFTTSIDAYAQALRDRAEATAAQNDAGGKVYASPEARANAIAAAELRRIQSENALIGASQAHLLAQKELVKALQDARFSMSNFIDGLTKKLGVPGLEMKRNDQGGFGGFALNPTSFLISAFEQTKAFGDVMNVVNQLMKVFAQLLDTLRPVIDAVLQAVGFVANIFIDLYNVIARILREFGIHVALLDRINVDFNKLDSTIAPFISIVHDIPTMNELASGKIGALSPTPASYSNLAQVQQPTIDAINGPDLGGGLLGALFKILASIEALRFLAGASGAGGILGTVVSIGQKIFGGGSGSSAAVDSFDVATGLPTNAAGQFLAPGGDLGANISPDALAAAGYGDGGGVADLSNAAGGSWADAPAGGGSSLFGSGTAATTVATVTAAVVAAAGIGDLGAKITGGNTQNGAIGGVVGAAALTAVAAASAGVSFGAAGAALLAGPAGWAMLAGAALLGGAAGGVFGPHINAHDNPDLAGDVSSYGQGLANLGGSGGYDSAPQYMANGQGFSENAALAQQLGGHGEVNYLSQYIAKTGGKGLDANLTSEFAGATGFSYLKDGMVQLSNGVTKYWSDLVADASLAIKEATAGITPSFQALSDSAQAISQNISAAGNDLVGSITNAGSGAAAALGVVARSVTGGDVAITQNITHNGDINNAGDMQDLAMFHGDALDRAVRARQYSLDRIAI